MSIAKFSLSFLILSVLCSCASTTSEQRNEQTTLENVPSITEKESQVSHLIEFAFDSSDLDEKAIATLNIHAKYLLDDPEQKVMLLGSADTVGDTTYNFELGLKRADVVASKLVDNGVSPFQIIKGSSGERGNIYSIPKAVVISY